MTEVKQWAPHVDGRRTAFFDARPGVLVKVEPEAGGSSDAANEERDTARAEVERLRAELATAVTAAKDEAKAEMRSRLAIILGARDGEDIEDAADRLRAQLEPVGKLDVEALAKRCAQIYMDAEGSTVTAFMGPVVENVAQAFVRAMLSEGAMRAFDAAYCEIVRHSKTEREIDAALLAGMRAALEHAGLHAVDAGSAFAAKRPSGIAIGTADSTDEAAHVGDVRRLALVVDGLVDEVRRLGGGGR